MARRNWMQFYFLNKDCKIAAQSKKKGQVVAASASSLHATSSITSAISMKLADTRQRYSACIPSRQLETIEKNYRVEGKQ